MNNIKTHLVFTIIVIVFSLLTLSAPLLQAQVEVIDLRCEYQKDPLGLGTPEPRLFWKLLSETPDQMHTAYQVRAASDPERLRAGAADLWDSGKVLSDRSIHVEYAGKPLQSRDRVWWKVRAWDRAGEPSSWSEPAFFEMGLLERDDWQAEFIKSALEFGEYSYPSPMLRKEFSLDKPIRRARVYATSLGLYELQLNGRKVGEE